MTPLLQIKNLSIEIPDNRRIQHVLSHLSFTLHKGETLAMVGESGSGKSLCALSVLQLLPPAARIRSGEILFSADGSSPVNLLSQSRRQMLPVRGNRIGMIFQEPMTSLNPVITCGRQVMETLIRHKRLSQDKARRQAIDLFKQVKLPRPSAVFQSYPHQLSGGEKQRVMIAMAISCKPSLLICDEPTTALDTTVQFSILQLLKELQETEKMGMLFITHDLGLVSSMAHRVIVMRHGEIMEAGSIAKIFHSPRTPYTRGLLNCRPALHARGKRLPVVDDFIENAAMGKFSDAAKAGSSAENKTDPMNSPSTAPETGGALPAGQVLLSVENLSVWYPSQTNFFGRALEYNKAVRDISFTIRKGEILGLVGESGCGKTTLGRTLLGLVRPHAGRIFFDGRDMATLSTRELKKLRKEIQIVFQDPYSSLNPKLTIGGAISEPLRVHGLALDRVEAKRKANNMLEKVNLPSAYYHRYPNAFSGGQRQRIVIARALVMEPSFVVFDESVSALDVSVQAQVLNLIHDLKNEFGLTIVFISHDLSVVKWLCDRILVMNNGKMVEIGPSEEVYHHPTSRYTQKLIDAIPKGSGIR